ncbi:uncharacterized protein MONBRDRAFT_10883 [Monosiga brevicollis MX1]|uniref:NOG C-terminal domain-containing protein n=1 Tax=Monosiga brevicollis TaxID=81824 RepID=A9V7I8_MONBE|nr:uncharacterized protein MONBRDRAFT_10883 [Monosiga brevicollis MX1]EDQ86522.1 predicted protein [Monosiga brevicollis MX1]|eukprot:XP_001748635.1 hypothetical protein [Monosiga brevicollis MX1]
MQDELSPEYSTDMRAEWDLKNNSWRYDAIPILVDGKNVADFIDPDGMAKLEELEMEEEARERAGEYDSESDDEADKVARAQSAMIRHKRMIIRQAAHLRKSRNAPVLPKAIRQKLKQLPKDVKRERREYFTDNEDGDAMDTSRDGDRDKRRGSGRRERSPIPRPEASFTARKQMDRQVDQAAAFAELLERLEEIKELNLSPEDSASALTRLLEERRAEREKRQAKAQAQAQAQAQAERQRRAEWQREERNAVLECLVRDFAPPQGYNLVKHLASMSVDKVSFLYTLCKKNLLTCDQLEIYLHIPEHKWTPKGASLPSNVEAKVPELPPSRTPKMSDINDDVEEKFHFGIVQLPPSCHYLALEIVQRAQKLLSANLPQEGIHTNLLRAYTNACLKNSEAQSHEPHFSSLITLALQDHFNAPALAATSAQVAVSSPSETEPLADTTASTLATKQASVRNPIYLVHQASLGSANMHADWVGFDVLLRPVIVGECKKSAQHFHAFGGQVGNQVVRLGLLGPKYQMRKDRQHPLHPFININVCGDIVTAYLVLHLTSRNMVAMIQKMKGLEKEYYVAFLRLGSAQISKNRADHQAVWALLTACREFVTGRQHQIIESGHRFPLSSEPFPCPARGMAGWTCNETYGPHVRHWEKKEKEEEEESQHSPEAQSGNVTPCQSRQPSHDELSLKDLVVEAVAEEETVQTQQRPKPMAFLIDFDLGGPCDKATYGPRYNYEGGLEKYRHANARPDERLQKAHDGYSLARVAEDLLEDNDARKRLVRALEAVKLDEAIELCRACTGRSGRC